MSTCTPVCSCLDCPPTSLPPTSSTPLAAPPKKQPDPRLLDPTTFIPPNLNSTSNEETPRVVIEFCDRCRWVHRASWCMTELFMTFPTTSSTGLKAITLLPRTAEETGGRFRIWLYLDSQGLGQVEKGEEKWGGAKLVWDRKIEGGFPELKELKQRIRNLIAPEQGLGHSDKGPNGRIAEAEAAAKGKSKAGAVLDLEPPVDVEEQKKEMEREVVEDDYSPRFRC